MFQLLFIEKSNPSNNKNKNLFNDIVRPNFVEYRHSARDHMHVVNQTHKINLNATSKILLDGRKEVIYGFVERSCMSKNRISNP